MFFFCKQKTAYEMRISDWSSDVCSSDLALLHTRAIQGPLPAPLWSDRPCSEKVAWQVLQSSVLQLHWASLRYPECANHCLGLRRARLQIAPRRWQGLAPLDPNPSS